MKRQLTPTPRLALASTVDRHASAAVDISDGLLRDLGHLCARSGVGAELHADDLPIEPGATLEDALAGGEDYELLIAATPDAARRVLKARTEVPITAIGRITADRAISLVRRDGAPVLPPRGTGFDHFRRTRRR